MKDSIKALCGELTEAIKISYEESVTMQEAEKLAGRFLHAQLVLADALRQCDLDARMKKAGLKAIKASVYLDAATQGEKKPSDTLLNNIVDADKTVQDSQRLFDEAEIERDFLLNHMSVFKEAHVHFRTIAKGSFNG